MFDPRHLRTFVEIVRSGSMVKAALRLNYPTTRISRDLSGLESALNLRLLNRTTRSMSLTDAGRLYFEQVEPIVDAMKLANRMATRVSHQIEGRLHITAPQLLGERYLFDRVMAFQKKYPMVNIDLQLDNENLNLPATGIDFAVRAGELVDSSLVARHLSDEQFKLVASPIYLERVNLPQTPNDLEHLAAITTGARATHSGWKFTRGKTVRIRPNGRLHFNDLGLALRAALAHQGLALLPETIVNEHLNCGKLIEVLPRWRCKSKPIFLIYQSRRFLTLAQQAFIDFICVR